MTSEGPRTLFIDIETAPNLAYVWDLWNQNVGLSQLVESTEILCFSAKWKGAKGRPFWLSKFTEGHDTMIDCAWQLLHDADYVVHYNGKRFDVPHLNREFLEMEYAPPSPFRQIDLYETIKRQFAFPSNKLAYVAPRLGIGGKMKHQGFELWTRCMAGDPEAWKVMRRYNTQDVVLLEQGYERLLPWIPNHPNVGALTGDLVCPACGADGEHLHLEGHAYTQQGKFQRYRCGACGKWSRGTRREQAAELAAIAS